MARTPTQADSHTDGGRDELPSIPVQSPAAEERGLRWRGPWTGAVIALPVFVVLQLLCLSFGWVGPDRGDGVNGVVSAVLGVVALLVGGAACGATSRTRTAPGTALLEGAATWALTVVGVLGLGLAGAGTLLGSVGGAASTLGTTAVAAGTPTAASVHDVAGWAALWLGVAFAAAVGGALATREAVASRHPASGGRAR